MRGVLVGICSCLLGAASAASILNGAFADDGFGGVLDWGFGRTSDKVAFTRLAEKAPDGSAALRLTGGPGEFVFRHTALRLVAGENYRISVWVRTRNLASIKRKEFEIHNNGWSKSVYVALPDDTAGAWQKLEWTGPMMPSDGNLWQCLFYFSSFTPDCLVEVAAPSVEPLSEKGVAGSRPVVPFSKPFTPRILPIDPLISEVDAREGRLTFFYPGLLEKGYEAYVLKGTLAGVGEAAGTLSEKGRATLAFGALKPGRYTLTVQMVEKASGKVLAANDYSIKAKLPLVCPTVGRRLNNFVTELFTVPLADDHYEFVNPRDGWVFIGFDKPHKGVIANLDHGTEAVVRFRPHEPSETMRYLSAGSHVVTVRGATAAGIKDGTLSVRLVKRLQHSGGRFYRQKTDVAEYTWGPAFYHRFNMHFFNETTSEAKRYRKNGQPIPEWMKALDAELAERGIRVNDMFGIGPSDPIRNDPVALTAKMVGFAKEADGREFGIDENSVGAARLAHYNWGGACWKVWNPVQSIGVFFNDATSSSFIDPVGHTLELSATLNSGDGSAYLSPEVYLRVKEDEQDAYLQEDYFLNWAETARACVPSAPAHIIYYLGGWLSQGQWTPYYCPEADIKVLYDHFLHRLATDPRFADLGGAGFSNPSCDECIFRWSAKLLHYYCIEGGTEPLAPKYGYKYRPELLRNGEFLDGFEGWKVQAAEADALKTDTIPGFRKKGLRRCFPNAGRPEQRPWGDAFALFTRSAKGPNVLRQQVTGLEKGRTYEFMFCTADHANVLKERQAPETYTFTARIAGAEEIPALAYRHNSQMLAMDRKAGRVLPCIVTHRIVFRATGPEAEIIFSDWQDAQTPGGPVGERRLLNFVALWPYYEGEPGDMDALGEMLTPKK